jgi:hypothetical protein
VGECFAAVGRDVVGPVVVVLGEDGWPAGNVDVDVLGVFVVSEESLRVFPAIEARYLAELGGVHVVQGFTLAIAVDGALNVGWLDLATVEDDRAGFVDIRLSNVKSTLVSLTVSQDDKNTCLPDSRSDLVHLGRLPLEGVLKVLVNPCGVFDGRVGPNAPWIARNKHFGEANYVGAVACGILDEADGFLDATLEILPDRLGLDSGNLESLGHVDEMGT